MQNNPPSHRKMTSNNLMNYNKPPIISKPEKKEKVIVDSKTILSQKNNGLSEIEIQRRKLAALRANYVNNNQSPHNNNSPNINLRKN